MDQANNWWVTGLGRLVGNPWLHISCKKEIIFPSWLLASRNMGLLFLNFPIFCTVQIISSVKCPPGGLVWCFLTIKFRLASDYAFFLFGQKHPSVTEHPFGNYILCSFVPVTMSLTFVTCLRWGVQVFSTVKLLFLPLSLKVICVEMLWGYVNILFLLKLFLSCLGLWFRFSTARTTLS